MPHTKVDCELDMKKILDEIGTVEYTIAVDMKEPDDYRGHISNMDKFRDECHELARKFYKECMKQACTLATEDPEGDIAKWALAEIQGEEIDRRYDEKRDREMLNEPE